MIPKSVVIILVIRYTVIFTYLLTLYGLVFSALNEVFRIDNESESAHDTDNNYYIYQNCSIYHGIQKNTYIITGMSSLMWTGPLYWHIHLTNMQWNILKNNVISPVDNWVLRHRINYVYFNIWLFLVSISYLPNLAMHQHECNTPLIRKLITIHCLNILPVATQFGVYIAKLTILFVLALSMAIKHVMFKTFTATGWYLHKTVTGDFTLLQIEQTPDIESNISRNTSRSVRANVIAGDKQCPICMEDEIPVMVTLECKHEMCISCCKEWLESHTTCPFCRDNLAAHELPESQAVIIETADV